MKSDLNFRSLTARGVWTNTFVPEPFRRMQLVDYPATTGQHRAALEAAQEYVTATRAGTRRPFILFGRQGSGKTMLASCMWNELAASVPDRGSYDDAQLAGTADNIAFMNGAELAPWFRKDSEDESKTPAQKRYHIGTCYLAVLDDLDKFPAGEWGNELFNLIDSRLWEYRRPTIITMNLTPQALARRYGEAGRSIVDRFVRAGNVFVRLDEKLGPPSQVKSGRKDEAAAMDDSESGSVEEPAMALAGVG
jgi:DNA replication protein DnaC